MAAALTPTALPTPDSLLRILGVPVKNEIDLVALGTGLITLAAVVVAIWAASRQISAAILQNRSTTLLNLDERWESSPLVLARDELRKLMIQVSAEASTEWPDLTEVERRQLIFSLYDAKLQEMRKREDRWETYTRLFVICGFLETVGYTARANYTSVKDIVDLLGVSIGGAGMVFEVHIRRLQNEQGGDRRHFEHFLWLVEQARAAGY